MTSGSDPKEVIDGVLETLRQSRTLLLDPSPQNIDRCRASVAQCVGKIRGLAAANRAARNGGELRDALLLVRSELSAIAELLDSAAVFHRGMLKSITAAARPRAAEADAPTQKARRLHVVG